MKPEKPWIPFVLPIAIFAFVALMLAGFGILLLWIALITHDMAPKAVPSLYVIIVALILSLVVAVAGGGYALSGRRSSTPTEPPPPHH